MCRKAYDQNAKVGDFDARTAPVFFPNQVGGYMPAKPGTAQAVTQGPSAGKPSTIAAALLKGFVVASPGARGRTLKDADGAFTGKAPAAIVDLKAAVRYLRLNASVLPGDMEKIFSNGTSAGGALSALLGASGNSRTMSPICKPLAQRRGGTTFLRCRPTARLPTLSMPTPRTNGCLTG